MTRQLSFDVVDVAGLVLECVVSFLGADEAQPVVPDREAVLEKGVLGDVIVEATLGILPLHVLGDRPVDWELG